VQKSVAAPLLGSSAVVRECGCQRRLKFRRTLKTHCANSSACLYKEHSGHRYSCAAVSVEATDEARAGDGSPIMSEAKQGESASGETASSTASASGDPAQMWPQVTDAMKGLPESNL
jgi:hypothetical protein